MTRSFIAPSSRVGDLCLKKLSCILYNNEVVSFHLRRVVVRRIFTSRSGGIGRRAWFRSMYPQGCGGSSPFFGTNVLLFSCTYKPSCLYSCPCFGCLRGHRGVSAAIHPSPRTRRLGRPVERGYSRKRGGFGGRPPSPQCLPPERQNQNLDHHRMGSKCNHCALARGVLKIAPLEKPKQGGFPPDSSLLLAERPIAENRRNSSTSRATRFITSYQALVLLQPCLFRALCSQFTYGST